MNPQFQLLAGDCLEVLQNLPDSSLDCCITDPPYGLNFMGKKWDCEVPSVAIWREVLRVLKPGGHLLAFFGTRTQHRGVVAIEDAAFEIRDSIVWIYGQGFPKSHNLGDGRGTALKPAHEPICVARKPFSGTIAANVQEWGTGAINVDECRIVGAPRDLRDARAQTTVSQFGAMDGSKAVGMTTQGRWPANVIHDGSQEVLDAFAEFGQRATNGRHGDSGNGKATGLFGIGSTRQTTYFDSGSVARFFYAAKASKRERGEGNNHPTVKPISLMQYLVKLVTREGDTVLDPFCGSGSTGVAALGLGRNFVGIERDQDYFNIAQNRLQLTKQNADSPSAN